MTIAFFWLVFSIAVGILAGNRGRGSGNWFLLSLLISPLLGLIFCLVSEDLTKTAYASNNKTHVKCPACAEWVLPEASVCKHCGQALVPDLNFRTQSQQADMQSKAKSAVMAAAAFLLCIGAVIAWAMRG